ncbi:hypothetical protein PR048_020219 [Dryococelus australis]|uniref:Uncharacterized protein n=1 Tax=Dryococelus australis TaxID=614101 RepID=A0ABQ9H5Q2_9NEOP|nr:hypothetical protein PR048_020219 [Dryococelus australis]
MRPEDVARTRPPRVSQDAADEVQMEVIADWQGHRLCSSPRNENAGGNGRSPRKPTDQCHRPARFPHVKIRGWPRLGGRRVIYTTVTPPVVGLRSNGRGSGGVVIRLLASRLSKPGSIPGKVAAGFSHVGIKPDDAACWRVFLGSPVSPAIASLLNINHNSPSSTLKTSSHESGVLSLWCNLPDLVKLSLYEAEEYPGSRTLAVLQKTPKIPRGAGFQIIARMTEKWVQLYSARLQACRSPYALHPMLDFSVSVTEVSLVCKGKRLSPGASRDCLSLRSSDTKSLVFKGSSIDLLSIGYLNLCLASLSHAPNIHKWDPRLHFEMAMEHQPNNDVPRFLRSKAGLYHSFNVLACWQSGVFLQTPRPENHIDVFTIFHILQHVWAFCSAQLHMRSQYHGERNTNFEPSFGINGNTVAIFDSPACNFGCRQLIRRYARISLLVHLGTIEKEGDAIHQVKNSIAHYLCRCWIGPIFFRQSSPDLQERLARKSADILVLDRYTNFRW